MHWFVIPSRFIISAQISAEPVEGTGEMVSVGAGLLPVVPLAEGLGKEVGNQSEHCRQSENGEHRRREGAIDEGCDQNRHKVGNEALR